MSKVMAIEVRLGLGFGTALKKQAGVNLRHNLALAVEGEPDESQFARF